MNFFNKYFFIGLASGILTTLAFIFLAGYIFWRMYIGATMQKMESNLPTLTFPVLKSASSLGQTDYQWELQTLDGEKINFSEFKGKVIFLNLWATWCSPCVAEMPSIQKLFNSFRNNKNVAFVLVSDEDEETVKKFIRKKKFDFPVYLRTTEPPSLFASRGIPATFILDKSGRVLFKHIGSANWDDANCKKFILSLINES